MSGSGPGSGPGAGAGEASPPAELDERDLEPRTPMKRLGSTRKLAAFNNIRLQLAEQSRVLEARAEATGGVAGELHDYCRRRADLEHEYSRALDKLTRAAHQRHKEQRQRRAQWPLTGAHACWQAALESARTLARSHAALADLYGGPLAARLARAAEDALRLHRKCRAVVLERHEELGAALGAAAAAGKAHAALHARWRAAALKLRAAKDLRRDPPKHKKIKALDKELEKRRARHSAARAEALRARVECVLSLEAANATLQRYYLDDIADIALCTEVGFEAVVGRVVRAAAAAESARGAAAGGAAAALALAAQALDALADRQRLLDAHPAAFSLPRPLPHPPAPAPDPDPERREEDEEEEPGEEERALARELEARLAQLEAGARSLRAECRENAKTLDAAEAELVKQMEGSDSQWDVSSLFGAGALGGGALGALAAPPPPLDDQEDYYLAKFRAYVSSASRLARVESKAAALRSGAALGAPPSPGAAPPAPPASPPRRAARAPRPARTHFTAPLDTRLPRVLTECVRVISTYGLRHQGLFRVSGSQVEMQALRAAFERGEDPLVEVRDASDINSVCGLLKLWLRELRPPLLPSALQTRLLAAAALPADERFAPCLRAALAGLPLPHVLVLRYLFAFLAHVAAHSASTCMDAWNLAICVGPTLLAAGGHSPHQLHQQNLLNELVKRTILLHEEVFPQDVAPHALYSPPIPPDGEEGELTGEQSEPDGGGNRLEGLEGLEGEEEEEEEEEEPERPPDASDTDEESSEEVDSGEWTGPGLCRRTSGAERRASQVSELPAPAPAPALASAPDAPAAPEHCTPAGQCRRLVESTPDLVLDLPLRAAPPAATPPGPVPAPPAPLSAPPADSADTFAHNRDTLKKRPHKQVEPERASETSTSGVGGPPSAEGRGKGEGGSPVPARNTARVCAKFAELTLTGGSLKPALAAKPALLRRAAPPAAPPAAPAEPPATPATAPLPPHV